MSYNFAMTGAAGYIAPRHLQAIRDTGNNLVAALDPHDSVGILDSYFPDCAYFREPERFDRHIEKLRRGPESDQVNYVTICSPNFLHDAHIRLALRSGAHAICEKPLVLNPWNCDALQDLEEESGRHIYTILQLRVHPSVVALKQKIDAETGGERHEVNLQYMTSRGKWYLFSWKGDEYKSGGLATNIGIHFFDMLMWIFGGVESSKVTLKEATKCAGKLELEKATVNWRLSIDSNDLPEEAVKTGKSTFRSITVDGDEFEFSGGFTDLHTMVYKETLAGNGFRIADAKPAIELAHAIREG
ncbi:MAG: Gfo/Idh/MocA family oxidoreductase [Planctomycetes bacterium]|nr:Gfo/Idh/MocA family oxidoreductase [Planctomycetota bacterium]